jgi:MtN3 and saliva related transmembrane protein
MERRDPGSRAAGQALLGLAMNHAEIIGAVAAVLTTSSFLPQAVKVVRTGDTAAISLAMYLLFTAGVTLWLVYGLLTSQWSIIIANGVTILLAATILVMKVRSLLKPRQS